MGTDKLLEVDAAKQLMTEALTWSVMKWLREKKSVRKAADQANAALDQSRKSAGERWPADIRFAYDALAKNGNGAARGAMKAFPSAGDPKAALLARKIKEADDEARRARADAEKTFDDAEKQLSTSLAREGCRKAILSWELHEVAIRHAESGIR